MDKNIEEDHSMVTGIGMTLWEQTLERHKIIKVRIIEIIEVDIETIKEMIIETITEEKSYLYSFYRDNF